MRKLLDNLHPQNFNRENPGFMLNHEIYMPRKIPGVRYTTDNSEQFKVVSSRDTGEVYTVDMSVGFCTCVLGSDGSPCSHQAAVAINFRKFSLNFIPTMRENLWHILH